MRKPSKEKARQERIRVQKHLDAVRSLYPRVAYFNTKISSPDLVEAVKGAVDFIGFHRWLLRRSPKYEIYADFLKSIRREGKLPGAQFQTICRKFDESFACDPNLFMFKDGRIKVRDYECAVGNSSVTIYDFAQHLSNFIYLLGIYIHERIDERVRAKHMPHHWFRITLLAHEIGIVFYRLERKHTPDGRIYALHYRRTIEHEGKHYQIALTSHALDRFLQRQINGVDTHPFIRQDSFYEFMTACRYVLRTDGAGNHMIETYLPLELCSVSNELCSWVREYFYEFPSIETGSAVSQRACGFGRTGVAEETYLKMFYSPVRFDGDRAVIVTNLVPGYKNTPEYDFWKNSRILFREDFHMMKSYFSIPSVETRENAFEKIQIIFYQNDFVQFRRGVGAPNLKWQADALRIHDRITD